MRKKKLSKTNLSPMAALWIRAIKDFAEQANISQEDATRAIMAEFHK